MQSHSQVKFITRLDETSLLLVIVELILSTQTPHSMARTATSKSQQTEYEITRSWFNTNQPRDDNQKICFVLRVADNRTSISFRTARGK